MRAFLLAASAALALGACASPARDSDTPAPAFGSDRITVVTRGNGPDIVLVPGLASSRDVWAGVADSLEHRYRLHLVQVKGFAGLAAEANGDGPVSAPAVEDIARYIHESKLERPAVIGHSMGGTIAMMLASRHPDVVGRLMVVDMHPFLGATFAPPGATPEDIGRAADEFRGKILADSAGSPNGVLEQMFPGMTRVDSMKPRLLEGVRGTDRRTAANAFYELMTTDMRPELSPIKVPMTVLYVIPVPPPMPPAQFERAVRESYANAPHARVVKVEQSNHFIQFDQPGRFMAEVDTLMRAGSPGR
jgi:pimeloyl-ACP methyl ester carboxylesterase